MEDSITTSEFVIEPEYPVAQAASGRFRHGLPGSFVGSESGSRVAFIRSASGTDSRGSIWLAEQGDDGQYRERILVDIDALDMATDSELPREELARRERLRESGSGITAFSADDHLETLCFALGGSLFVLNIDNTTSRDQISELEVPGPVVDPRINRQGTMIAWVSAGSLFACATNDPESSQRVAASEHEDHSWGFANFLAAEEFDRFRGFWWSPDGRSILAEEVDTSDVDSWWISSPESPSDQPRQVRYPAAGGANPKLGLSIFHIDDESHWARVEVDLGEFEYITRVAWTSGSGPLVTLMNRPQTLALVREVDPRDGSSLELQSISDECWVEFIPGTPQLLSSGQLLASGGGDSAGHLTIDGVPRTLKEGHVRAVYGELNPKSDESDAVTLLVGFNLNATSNQLGLLRTEPGDEEVALKIEPIGLDAGWTSCVMLGGTKVLVTHSSIDSFATSFEICTLDGSELSLDFIVKANNDTPPLDLSIDLHKTTKSELNLAVQWPKDHVPGSRALPVILNPYGGPHAQRVIQSGRAFAETQWLANQGFCVIVADGRGSPGRGAKWERAIFRDLANPPLDDQVEAIEWAANNWPDDIDATRVGISGWSFGGYLAALAVLRRPDVFKAAIAGAPVTDWRLYDTAYTERYLGNPIADSTPYDATALMPMASQLEQPLMLIHGLADDNVFAAHSLQLSSALTNAGKVHTFVPLTNVTHMTPQIEVAANLLRIQAMFFIEHLKA